MNRNIAQIINKAIDGGELTGLELSRLLTVDYLSEEAYMIQYAARKISAAAAGGKAEVHAQVGINAGPCPKNCHFCSFAPVNKIFEAEKVYSLEEIIDKALVFEADGANAIYLMATATYGLPAYLAVARAVRTALKPETPLVGNVDDFAEDGAIALKQAGFAGVYHVLRMGEGRVTNIAPGTRLRTIAAARQAGLLVGTCVEPVGPEHTVEEIVEKTMLIKEIRPVHAGSGRRINIPGSPLEPYGALTQARQAHIIAAVKLAFGYSVPGHCGGDYGIAAMAGVNLSWAESGSNPRDTQANTVIGGTVASRRETFQQAGWEMVEGPSVLFSPG
ncbi:radical SAM protein [Sporomusa termitida]|uniref:Biotin synthase n=1 Tax=Sporomusa termitida TaxID=2377 RepID=A0A517DWG2_9FIRM|nr:radical SAM protein [Sporomusa termitida]QDR81690.1 Biotin synthase [Sporomusa termitida]